MRRIFACLLLLSLSLGASAQYRPFSGGTEDGVGIAVAKGNQEMLDKLNAALQNYRGTAAYYQMKNTYFGKLM